MNKLLLFTFCTLLSSNIIFSQDSLGLQKSSSLNSFAPPPLIIIKGEAFRRFSSGSFLDAVNGLFPGVFSQTPDANNFVFVVNGFLLSDINSISLNDIEEVSFSRNNVNGSLYPFSRPGTFYITTHTYTGKTSFNFNTQYNAALQKNNATSVSSINLVNTKSVKTHPGHLLSNHLSVLTGGKKWELYTAVQFAQTTLPKSENTTVSYYSGIRWDSSIITGKEKQMNITSFAKFTYRFSSTLQAGISGNYFHGAANSDTSLSEYISPDMHGRATAAITSTLPYYNAAAFIYWAPLQHLSNRVTFEYTEDKLQADNGSTGIGFSTTDSNLIHKTGASVIMHSKSMLLRDELEYNFSTPSKFKSGIKVIFSYLCQNADYENNYFSSYSNGSASSSNQRFKGFQKITSLNPGFYFSYNQIISGYAGYAFQLNKGGSAYTSGSKTNPYAGLSFDVKKIIKAGGHLDRLDVSVDYANLLKNNSNNNWLPGIDKPFQFSPLALLDASIAPSPPGTYKLGLLKNSLIALQINAAFFNNRLLAGAEFTKQHSDNLYPGFIFNVNIPESQKAFSAFIATRLINQPMKTWMIRFNMLVAPYADYSLSYTPNTNIKSLHDQFQMGLQNNFSFKNWYAQIHGLMALNSRTVNTYLLNYLLIGYQFSGVPGKLLQNTSVFVQARNLLSSGGGRDYYGYYTYMGAGINFTL